MRLILFLVANLIFLIGCGSNTKSAQKEGKTELDSDNSEITTTKLKFPIYDYNGLKPLLHKEDDKTYIINFWATWCKPCVEELPYFEQVLQEQKDNNVEVVLVSLDLPSMWKTKLEPFVAKKQLQSEVVILDDTNMNFWIPQINKDWSGAIPATIIYNKNKRAFFEKGFTYEELNAELHKFLNQKI